MHESAQTRIYNVIYIIEYRKIWNAIFYSNVDVIVAIITCVKCDFIELNGSNPSCDINKHYWVKKGAGFDMYCRVFLFQLK